MKPMTYRILLLSLFIIGLSQTSYGNNFKPVNPNIEVHDWDSCMRAYVSAGTCGYFGYQQSELPQPIIEGAPLYGNNEDPFWEEERPDPSTIVPELNEEGSDPISAAQAINCRNNAGGLAMSRAQSLFIELDAFKRQLLLTPIEERYSELGEIFNNINDSQRLLQARCPGVEAVAPETFDLNYDLPSGDRFIAEEGYDDPLPFDPLVEGDRLPDPDDYSPPYPQEEYNMPIPIPQERPLRTTPQWSET